MHKRPAVSVGIGAELVHQFTDVLEDQAHRMDQYRSEGEIPSRSPEERDVVRHLLAGLSDSLLRLQKVKKECSYFCGHVDPWGEYVEARFQGLGARVTYGMYGWKLYLSLDLAKAEYLRNMKDDFWSEVAALPKCGQASFMPFKPMDGSGSSADKALLAKDKSLVFSLVRSCIFLAQTGEDSADFGSLELSWPVIGDKGGDSGRTPGRNGASLPNCIPPIPSGIPDHACSEFPGRHLTHRRGLVTSDSALPITRKRGHDALVGKNSRISIRP